MGGQGYLQGGSKGPRERECGEGVKVTGGKGGGKEDQARPPRTLYVNTNTRTRTLLVARKSSRASSTSRQAKNLVDWKKLGVSALKKVWKGDGECFAT